MSSIRCLRVRIANLHWLKRSDRHVIATCRLWISLRALPVIGYPTRCTQHTQYQWIKACLPPTASAQIHRPPSKPGDENKIMNNKKRSMIGWRSKQDNSNLTDFQRIRSWIRISKSINNLCEIHRFNGLISSGKMLSIVVNTFASVETHRKSYRIMNLNMYNLIKLFEHIWVCCKSYLTIVNVSTPMNV